MEKIFIKKQTKINRMSPKRRKISGIGKEKVTDIRIPLIVRVIQLSAETVVSVAAWDSVLQITTPDHFSVFLTALAEKTQHSRLCFQKASGIIDPVICRTLY